MYASAERTTSQPQSTHRAVAGPRPASRTTLRRTAGTAQVPRPSVIQLKLATGPVDDPLEHEADRAADQVMRMPNAELSIAAAPLQISRKCAACEEHEDHKCESCEEEAKGEQKRLRMKPAGSGVPAPDEAPPIVEEMLREPGQPLDAATRTFFELRFGHDFSGVRVHTDENAAESAQAVGARAYTVGTHIAFAASNFAPSTDHGRRLVAHELAHVVQQGGHAKAVQRDIDRRWVNDVTAARYRGKVMADRIHHHGLLSKEARAKIHREMDYFQGAAHESYIDVVQPALRAVKSDLDLRPKPAEPTPPSKEKEAPEKQEQPPVCKPLPAAGSGKKCKFFTYDSTLGGALGSLWEAAALADAAARPATYVIPSGDSMEELLETLLSTYASEDCDCTDEIQFWSHGSHGNGAFISGAKKGGTEEITAASFDSPGLDKYGDDRSQPGYQEWESKLSTFQRRLMLVRRTICDSDSTVYYRSCEAFQGEEGQKFAKASSRFWRCDVSGHTKSIGLTQPGKHTISVCQEPDWPVSEGADEETKKDKEKLHNVKPE
jgi:hypothetical protein